MGKNRNMQDNATIYRILHCGKSLKNYEICIKSQIVGFMRRGAEPGDRIYLAVKVDGESYCGARGILGNITDDSPWQGDDLFIHRLRLKSIEFCNPFNIKILAAIGGPYWPLKYLQGAKAIKDHEARQLLDFTFESQVTSDYICPSLGLEPTQDMTMRTQEDNVIDTMSDDIDPILEPEISLDLELSSTGIEDYSIDISGTFETVHFKNETDQFQGLETLVNQYFYSLFPAYPESRTLLIPENRMFLSAGTEAITPDLSMTGIRGIPDALLLVYDRDAPHPFQINLIEYECYGESKTSSLKKSQYLNGHIIPQLMKFASSFSVVTDRQIRQKTAKLWISKIIDYVFQGSDREAKVMGWIKELYRELPDRQMALKFSECLESTFANNIQILLVIDELSSEQKSTIGNVIQAFRLENQKGIQFKGYVVRLERKIDLLNRDAEFAISIESP